MKILRLFFLCLFAAALASPSYAATVLTIRPQPQNPSIGSTVTADLVISGVNDGSTGALGAWDIDLTFDPALLSFKSAIFGNQLDVLGLGSIQNTTSFADKINLFEVSLDSSADLASLQQSSFTLATLSFTALANGTSSLLLTMNSLSDADGNAIESTKTDGQISISGQTSAVPLPAAIWLFGGALLSLAVVAKRR